MIVLHQDDYVELTLVNEPDNTMQRNIGLHATTGGAVGGVQTMVNPSEQVTLRFKATRFGAFIYHCAVGGELALAHRLGHERRDRGYRATASRTLRASR
jgi:nitrite reductase (NO-forming)